MTTLLKALQTQLAAPAMPAADKPLNLDQILAAKSGKAVSATAAPGGANVLGDVAQAATTQALTQQAQTGQVAAAELASKDAQLTQNIESNKAAQAQGIRLDNADMIRKALAQRAELATNREIATTKRSAEEDARIQAIVDQNTLRIADMASQYNTTRNDLFAKARMDRAELAGRRDMASLEQRAHLLAMGDKAYVNEITRIGAIRNLQDKAQFAREAEDIAYGKNVAKMMDEINFKRGQNADQRTMQEEVARLSNYEVISLALAKAEQENMQAKYKAYSEGAKGLINAASQYDWSSPGTATVAPTPAEQEAQQSLMDRGEPASATQSLNYSRWK